MAVAQTAPQASAEEPSWALRFALRQNEKEVMMHYFKIVWFLLVTLGLIGFMGGDSPAVASTSISHATHFFSDKGPRLSHDESGCLVCHAPGELQCQGQPLFADMNFLAVTNVCDNCHSSGGGYDGVAMAKANWATGIYEPDGETLRSGNELWCATCHDEEPAYSSSTESIVIDNPTASFVGSWSSWASDSEVWLFYGDNFRYKTAGVGSNTATWTPDIPQAGTYSVYAWWSANSNRATNAPYTIHYNGGSETIEVNQRTNGGTWNYLGTFTFAAGTSGDVVLSDNADGLVIADAIKFEKGGQATYAPNVTGDNSTYGFYVTGHKINCLSCHDANKAHIDGEHRTYEADEDTHLAINPYSESYRLQEVNGLPAMNLPRVSASNNPHTDHEDFALCFQCHNRFEVLGEEFSDVSNTNFWNYDSNIGNSHWIHLRMNNIHFDSDWDGTADSCENCITCHNVHGSPTGPMIRHGEMISSPGTTNNVPALNFYYLIAGDGSATATFTPTLVGGTYDVYAWWSTNANRATNAKYLIIHDGGQAEVVVNQEQNGSQWNLLGQYSITTSSGAVILTSDGANEYIMADGIRWVRTDGQDEVIMDDPEAVYVGTWTEGTSSPENYYGPSTNYYYAPVKDTNFPVEDSLGGTFACSAVLAGGNHVCQMCHSNVTWHRQPYTGPRIPFTLADPQDVSNYINNTVLFTAKVIDTGDNVTSCTVNLTAVAGSVDQLMYDDGTHGDVTAGDGTYSYQHTIPAGISDGPRKLTVTATDGDGQSGQGIIDFTVTQPGALIVDNPDATFVGTWTETTSGNERYLDSYHYHAAGSGTNTATWTVSIPTEDDYNVYAWWVKSDNRATNAPYTINYEGGFETVRVSQQVSGGMWVLLGTYHFAVGDYTVVLSDDADNFVIADAIKLAPATGGPPEYLPWPIADNPDAHMVGPWKTSEGGSKYGEDFYYDSAGSGSDTATWTLKVPSTDTYSVYAWWAEGTNRATDSPYTINYEGGSETVRVSQRIKGGQWNCLGTYPFNAANHTVVLSDDADDIVIADAIKFEAGNCAVKAQYPVADNPDAEYVGPWILYDPDTEEYGDDCYYLPEGDGSNSATWTIAVPEAGTYNVYAWWVEGLNRSPAAPYTINYKGGSATVEVNQQVHGGEWNYLGNFSFNAGNYTVVLTDVASGLVMADAIKFEQGDPPVITHPYPIIDNLDASFTGAWPASDWTDGGVPHDGNFQYHDQDAGATCTWNITIPPGQAGTHNVYAWWSEHSGRAANVPYTINYQGGSATVEVCQQIRGGRWNYLGNFPFVEGNYSVSLTAESNGRTTADAIRLEMGSALNAPYPIADNWDAVFVGPWAGSTWADGGEFQGSDYQYFTTSGSGTNTATWTIAIPTTGNYSVYTRWTEYSNRSPVAPYTISHDGGSTIVTVCQQIRGGQWNYLGNFHFTGGNNYIVQLSDDIPYIPGMTYLIADAVMFESGDPPAHPYPIVDNWDATFVGPWRGNTGAEQYLSDFQHCNYGDGTDVATWTTDIPEAGNYKVYAWWSSGTDRASNAPYTIYYDGGSQVVTVDQRYTGGQWMLLGTYLFDVGSYSVELHSVVNKIVIADAIKWEKE